MRKKKSDNNNFNLWHTDGTWKLSLNSTLLPQLHTLVCVCVCVCECTIYQMQNEHAKAQTYLSREWIFFSSSLSSQFLAFILFFNVHMFSFAFKNQDVPTSLCICMSYDYSVFWTRLSKPTRFRRLSSVPNTENEVNSLKIIAEKKHRIEGDFKRNFQTPDS